ncbi:MAG: DUF4112 domain-containing protein [Bacteroidota bacterium]
MRQNLPTEAHPTIQEQGDFQWLDTVSDLLDSKFRIPFTNIRFGADFLIGLVPYAGDFLSFGISGTLVIAMAKHGVSTGVLLKMLWNIALDALVGAIPILGDIFDLTYRANRRNLELLKKHYDKGKANGSTLPAVLTVIGVLIGILIIVGWLMWKLMVWMANFVTGIF